MPTRPGFIWSGTEWVDIGQNTVSPFKYQATAPTSPATGDVWIESDVDVPSFDSAQMLRWRKTMVGGETSLSGNDDSALALSYSPGYEQLYINGVLQVRNLDYIATTGNTITSLIALSANDVVEIFSILSRTVSDVYTQSQSDNRYFITSNQPAHRNILINGEFRIDQRNNGASQTFTAGAALAYSVDRWYGYCTGANITGARVAGSGSDQFFYRFTGASSNTAVGFGQRIEATNSYHFAGQTATLSVSLASTSLTSITWTAFYANTTDTFGSLASSTRTQIATGTFAVSSTLDRKIATFNIPSAATTGIEIVFTGGALIASQTLTFSNVQLELGLNATSYEQTPIGLELPLCQRYFINIVEPSGTTDFNIPLVRESATQAVATIFLPVTMRVRPSLVGSNIGRVVMRDTSFGTSVSNVSGITVSPNGPSLFCITLVIGHGSIGGGAVFAEWDVLNTTTNLSFSAEL